MRKRGWLKEQMQDAAAVVQSLPSWMQVEERTPLQRDKGVDSSKSSSAAERNDDEQGSASSNGEQGNARC